MPRHILVFYGSYRQGRQGIKLARWLVDAIDARGLEAIASAWVEAVA